jgi:chromosomal replication initiator protein
MSTTQNDSSGVIEEIREKLKEEIGENAFATYFILSVNWEVLQRDNSIKVVISSNNSAVVGYIKSTYLPIITSIIKKIDTHMSVILRHIPSQGIPAPARTLRRKKPSTPALPLPGMEKIELSCQIPADQTFDTFIVENGSNHIAYTICQSICNKSTEISGSILLHGSSGSGKSHLLFAMAHELLKEKNVLHTTAINFCKEYVKATGPDTPKNAPTLLNKKYISCDILLLDEMEALTGKPGTKKELRDIVQTLTKSGAIVVSTSTLNPQKLRARISKGDADNEGNLLVTTLSGSAFSIKPPSKKS